MVAKQKALRGFTVDVHPVLGVPEAIRVSYLPRGLQHERGPGGVPKQVKEFIALARHEGGKRSVLWEKPPWDKARSALEKDALYRLDMRLGWLNLLSELIGTVERWAKELDWSTRRIEKEMDDSEIGEYQAPALVVQKELTRVLLEPVGRSAPGAEGVVDLYLLPGYDDIASLYFYKDCWNLHTMAPETSAEASIREAEARPLTKAALRKVLEQMKSHAA